MKTWKHSDFNPSGYHRSTSHEKQRASASTEIHLKQSTRFKKSVANVTDFLDVHGERGEQVLRYEWRCWKRVLQTDEKHRWRPVLEPGGDVIKRIYREDRKAEDDFALICSREAIVRPVEREDVDGKDEVLHEYLGSVLQGDGQYSVSTRTTQPGPDGNLERVVKTVFFNLIETAHGGHRPKMMHTVSSADNVGLTAHFAMQIISHERFEPEDAPAIAPDTHHLYATSAPRVGETEIHCQWY